MSSRKVSFNTSHFVKVVKKKCPDGNKCKNRGCLLEHEYDTIFREDLPSNNGVK